MVPRYRFSGVADNRREGRERRGKGKRGACRLEHPKLSIHRSMQLRNLRVARARLVPAFPAFPASQLPSSFVGKFRRPERNSRSDIGALFDSRAKTSIIRFPAILKGHAWNRSRCPCEFHFFPNGYRGDAILSACRNDISDISVAILFTGAETKKKKKICRRLRTF